MAQVDSEGPADSVRVRWLMSGRAHQSPVALWLEGAWRPAELLGEELARAADGGGETRRWRLAAHGGRWLLSGPEGGPYRLEGLGSSGAGAPAR